jgi:hypothetical protein
MAASLQLHATPTPTTTFPPIPHQTICTDKRACCTVREKLNDTAEARERTATCCRGTVWPSSEGAVLALKLILGTVAGFTAIAAHAMPHVPPDLLSWLWPSSEGTTVHSNMRPRSQANRVKLHTCSVAHRTILSGDDASPSSSGNGHSYSQ